MPSTKVLTDDIIQLPEWRNVQQPNVKQPEEKAVVSYEQWIENEEDYLLNIYETLQYMNSQSGRQVFDTLTCNFPTFCRLAYEHSFKYKKRDKFIYDENDFASENADTYMLE